MKQGDIIENYQGRFAKVVEVKESLFGLSAFVMTKELAQDETTVDVFLNEFGVSQILPVKEEKAPKKEKEEKAK